jgi:hypothetical protein
VFHHAADLPAAERRPFVTRACGGDDALAAEVVRMLDEDATYTSLLDRHMAYAAHPIVLGAPLGRASSAIEIEWQSIAELRGRHRRR